MPMSYKIVVVSQGGEVTVQSVTGTVPDGQHEISGHEDDQVVQLGITRRAPDGRYAESASHSRQKEL